MIPDKIYVREYPVGLNQEWDEKPMVKTVAIAQHEYISKDALIEWIQEVRAIPHENAITRDLAFQEVVNKLNSM